MIDDIKNNELMIIQKECVGYYYKLFKDYYIDNV